MVLRGIISTFFKLLKDIKVEVPKVHSVQKALCYCHNFLNKLYLLKHFTINSLYMLDFFVSTMLSVKICLKKIKLNYILSSIWMFWPSIWISEVQSEPTNFTYNFPIMWLPWLFPVVHGVSF